MWIPTEEGKKIEGLVRKPDGSGPFPVVVFVSGFGMTLHEYKNSFDEISNDLVVQGIETLQFTFPIFDENGLCRELPLTTRANMTEEVLSWVHAQRDVDTKKIGVLAQSYGAATVLGVNLKLIKTLLVVSGAYFPKRSIAQVYREKGVNINYSGDTSLPRSSGENTTVGKEFWIDIDNFDDLGKAKQVHLPFLMIHGDHDSKIPVSDARKIFAAIASPKKKIKIFKGGDHGIVDVPRPMREEFLSDVAVWFAKTL